MDLKKLIDDTKDRTPGNWFNVLFLVQSEEGPVTASCHGDYSQNKGMTTAEIRANSVLMAAAPQLLDEVIRLNACIEDLKTRLDRITEVCGQDFTEWQSGKVAGLRIALSTLTPNEKHSWD
jgi:hypothetical protein